VTSPAFPDGTKLDVEVRQGTGADWVEGVTFSSPEFTVAELEADRYTGFLGNLKAGYKYIIATIVLTNTTGKMLEVDWSAEGYNALGEQVSKKFNFDAVFTLEHIAPGGSASGRIFVTWSEDIKWVTLSTHPILHPNFTPLFSQKRGFW